MIILMGPKTLHWKFISGSYLMIKLGSFYARIKYLTHDHIFASMSIEESDNVKMDFLAYFNWNKK